MTLKEAFSGLDDPRCGPAQWHDLTAIILMALCAVLCSADSGVEVDEWAKDNETWLKRYLALKHGTPSHDTFGRVFRLLDAKVFEACFRTWIGSLVGGVADVVAMDGKQAIPQAQPPLTTQNRRTAPRLPRFTTRSFPSGVNAMALNTAPRCKRNWLYNSCEQHTRRVNSATL